MTLVQKEVKKVYIWKEPYTNYSAMRGPCPDGFHVGSSTEWENIKTIWTTLGGSATSGYEFADTLKMPRAGYRVQSTGNVASQGTNGYYRLSEEGSTNELALSVDLTRYILDCSGANSRSQGYPIRPIKDSPVIADDSWTRLYGSSLSSGIYWNENLGLISLTKDGTDWITISDKNIGASNIGDRGYYYQWGNNYGFPTSGSVTTSSSQVNAGSYGPGNYYSSNTFITRSSSPYGRDSSNNGDLRGGETGTTQGGGDILIRPNKREPGNDTYVYIKGDGSITDRTGKTWTSQNISFDTDSNLGLTYINFAGTSANGIYTTSYNIPCPLTYNVWIYATGGGYASPRLLDNTQSNDSAIQIDYYNRSTIYIASSDTGVVLPTNQWVNLCITLDSSGNCEVTLNGESKYTGTGRLTNAATGMIIGYKKSNSSDYFQGRMSEIIIENRIRTSDEKIRYFNSTSSNYGI